MPSATRREPRCAATLIMKILVRLPRFLLAVVFWSAAVGRLSLCLLAVTFWSIVVVCAIQTAIHWWGAP
jgi:hypothetical protein